MKKRPIFQSIKNALLEPRQFIQVLLGPRQVGKTTIALQLAKEIGISHHYASADLAIIEGLPWLLTQWEIARRLIKKNQQALLIIDEVQKIPDWSLAIKQCWDEDTRLGINLKVLILGSSPWLMQQGLTESLAGRFENIPVTHWSYTEMSNQFAWDLETYIYFGGYPGAAPLMDHKDVTRWKNYINDSLIETTLSRDILMMTQVNKPALLRRLFQLGCLYSGQILSYQKMTGQLQDAGNTTTLAHYLNLLSGAGLLTGLSKYAPQPARIRASSPRFMAFNTALISAQNKFSYQEAIDNREYWGHLVESCIGSHLINAIRGTDIECYYWREGHLEVDFVLQKGTKCIAIEVKSGKKLQKTTGLDYFRKHYHPYKALIVGNAGIPIADFLSTSPNNWFDN